MAEPVQRIILGTAQFGMDYGIANAVGQLSDSLVEETLQVARAGGVEMLDTATLYGRSEESLGRAGVADLKVMTKLAAVPEDCQDIPGWIADQVAGSLERLRLPRLHGLSLHRPGQLLGSMGRQIFDTLESLKADGLVHAIGVSVYQPGELGPVFERRRFDLVQVPLNVFDHRLSRSGWVQRLQSLGCEIHARSIFLQGLLLLPSDRRPPWCERWQSLFDRWDRALGESGATPLEACVAHALSVPGVSRVIVGVDGPRQLEQILAAARVASPVVQDFVGSDDVDLLNPSHWPRA